MAEVDHNICVLYLVRPADGIAAFKRFIASYIACPAGIEHDLWIAFKGFSADQSLDEYHQASESIKCDTLSLPDRDFDIGSYWLAATNLHGRYRYFCFLNAHSELVQAGWLRYLYFWASVEGVGAVGATGSYESMYTDAVMAPRRRRGILRQTLSSVKRPLALLWLRLNFPPFPNPHLRTNAVMLTWDVMEKVWPRRVPTKWAAFKFESGANSLTNRLRAMGLKVLVVGRDGRPYEIEQWPSSNTFRMGQHANLLVADNRSRGFETAEPAEKLYLARMAWGDGINLECL